MDSFRGQVLEDWSQFRADNENYQPPWDIESIFANATGQKKQKPKYDYKFKNQRKGMIMQNIFEQLTKPLVKENPYLHMLLFGPMGGGKSLSSALCAIGLYKRRREFQEMKEPILIVNPERSARWIIEHFEKDKIPVRISDTGSPADLIKLMDAVKDGLAASLIVDPMTKHWYNYVNAYKEQHQLRFMSLEHWGKVIPGWRDLFSDRLATAPYDYFIGGRSGFEYDTETEEDEKGKKKVRFIKSGVKAKLEGETGYEPDIVIYTEQEQSMKDGELRVWVEQTVLKSRYEPLFGKTFKFHPQKPEETWETYAPAFEFLLENSKPAVNLPETDSSELFHSEPKSSAYREKQILIEEIEGILDSMAPNKKLPESRKFIGDMLEKCFQTRSWTKIKSELRTIDLTAGLVLLKEEKEKLSKKMADEIP